MIQIAGKKIPPWLLWGGGLGAGLVGIAYFRSRKNSSGAAASGAAGVDPVTGLPFAEDNQTDPLTGMTYLAEAQQYGSVSAAEAALAGSGSAYSASGQSPYVGTAGYPTSNVGTATAGQSFATNAAWAQAVTAGLVALGYSPTAVAAALGLYFQEHPLSADQASIVQAAVAEYGPPPVGSFPIIATTSSASPPAAGGGTTHGGGGGHPAAKVPAMPGNVHASAVSSSGFTLAWSPSAGATGYVVRVTYQGAVPFSSRVMGTSAHVTGLGPNRTYTAHVAAENTAGTSPETNGPTVKTSK